MSTKIAFYSFLRGQGRTTALVELAAVLAASGQRVVVVDMDLDDPDLHLRFEPPEKGPLGVSDYVLERLAGPELELKKFSYPVEGTDGRLVVVPAGGRHLELATAINGIYSGATERALIFKLFLARIAKEFEPDFILLDSGPGLSPSAAVCLNEMADGIIAFTGLSAPAVEGLVDVVDRVRAHPARARPAAWVLAYSKVPSGMVLTDYERIDGVVEVYSSPTLNRLQSEHVRLWSKLILEDALDVRQWHPMLPEHERLHFVEYDPWFEFGGEQERPTRVSIVRLARSVGFMAGRSFDIALGSDEGLAR